MKALILVDIQNDFVANGALAVPKGEEIIEIANQLQNSHFFDLIVATQDWHPANHGSFAANHANQNIGNLIDFNGLPQILWPVHCVQHTKGAALVANLETQNIDKIFYKGTDETIDSYSGFFDNGHRKQTGLGDFLKRNEVSEVYIIGLATDYCVKFTALDAKSLGFETYLIADACRAVNLQATDEVNALAVIKKAGVQILRSSDILEKNKK